MIDVRLQQIRSAALADRLDLLANRGHAMSDEFTDIWMALELLSYEANGAIDLLELEDVMNGGATSIYLSHVQRIELRLASKLAVEQVYLAP